MTIPNLADVPKAHYTLSGYHPAGARAIRIDMLERLADLLRAKDSRAGFEASPDMLSITGMTLDQFADLMAGLGYKGEKAERPKAKAAPAPVVPVVTEGSGNPVPEEESLLKPAEPEPESAPEPAADAETDVETDAVPEMEAFYTFTWAPRPRAPRHQPREPKVEGEAAPGGEGKPREHRPRDGKPRDGRPRDAKPHEGKPGDGKRRDGKPGGRSGDKPYGKGKPKGQDRDKGGRSFEAHPPKKSDRIDPDNPFAAALMGLRDKI